MQLSSANAIVFSNNNKKNFDPKKVKKWVSKLAHKRPKPFCLTVQPRPQPKVYSQYDEISGPDICSLICGYNPDW